VWCNILKGRDLEGLGEPEIRKLWNTYDKVSQLILIRFYSWPQDKNGTIDKKELQGLLNGLLQAIVSALAVSLVCSSRILALLGAFDGRRGEGYQGQRARARYQGPSAA
jgi:hypothetical protein